MQEKLQEIQREITEKISSFSSSKALYEFRKTFLDNKEGKISLLMKGLKDVPKEERPAVGKAINEVKEWALGLFEETDKIIHQKEIAEKIASESVDVTEPAAKKEFGSLHPISLIQNELIEIFASMGFEIYATAGTALALKKDMVPANVVKGIADDPDNNVLTLLDSGKIDYVISTSTHGRKPSLDSVQIRRKAVERSIVCLTCMDTANAVADCLMMDRSIDDIDLIDITTI